MCFFLCFRWDVNAHFERQEFITNANTCLNVTTAWIMYTNAQNECDVNQSYPITRFRCDYA